MQDTIQFSCYLRRVFSLDKWPAWVYNDQWRSILYICAERPISGNSGLKFCSVFVFTFPTYGLELHFELLLLYLRVKAQQYFVNTSYMFIDKKTFGLILV